MSSYFTSTLDGSTKKMLRDESRFRDALSEHLAFWTQLAAIIHRGHKKYVVTLPNYLPEDSGPDGLALSLSDTNVNIEIRSVKNSQNKPNNLVSSAKFRKGDVSNPDTKKQIEEFYLVSDGQFGFIRLDRLLSHAWLMLKKESTAQAFRAGLLKNHKGFNAVVVADDKFASFDMFKGFHLVDCPSASQRIVTYIGSDTWTSVAKAAFDQVTIILRNAGAL